MLLIVVGAACLGCASHSCTSIGGIDGVSVHLAGSLQGQLAGGTIRICIDASCSDQHVDLASSTVAGSCPDTNCANSGTAPEATANVFASMAPMVPRKHAVTVTVTATDTHGVLVAHGSADTPLADTYLNGPDCGVTSRVGEVTLTPTGLTGGS